MGSDALRRWRARRADRWAELRGSAPLERPTPEHWAALQARCLEQLGRPWRSNGVTFGPDTIWGVRIGRSGSSYADVLALPACEHDFWYGWGVPAGEDPVLRKAAVDVTFGVRMLERIELEAFWVIRPFARGRAAVYLEAVRSPLADLMFEWGPAPEIGAGAATRARPARRGRRKAAG